MDKNEIRAVINFFHLEGKTATDIKSRLDVVLRDSSLSFSTLALPAQMMNHVQDGDLT
jgi:hypothetical protein